MKWFFVIAYPSDGIFFFGGGTGRKNEFAIFFFRYYNLPFNPIHSGG